MSSGVSVGSAQRGLLVAALPRQCRFHVRGLGTEFLADDVAPGAALEEPAVLLRGEPAVGDPDDPPEDRLPHVGLDLADQRRVGGVPGPAPGPDRDAVARDGQADHDLRQVITTVLGLAVRPEPGSLARVGVLTVSSLLATPVPRR
jgi:hypothetical protein